MIECKACLVAALVAIIVLTLAAALGIWISPNVGSQTISETASGPAPIPIAMQAGKRGPSECT